MTDLKRARDLVEAWKSYSYPQFLQALAAARREGAEAERAKQGEDRALIRRAAELIRTQESGAYSEARLAARREGAADMRERAARVCDLEDCVRIKASALATAIRALPLTPEEPT